MAYHIRMFEVTSESKAAAADARWNAIAPKMDILICAAHIYRTIPLDGCIIWFVHRLQTIHVHLVKYAVSRCRLRLLCWQRLYWPKMLLIQKWWNIRRSEVKDLTRTYTTILLWCGYLTQTNMGTMGSYSFGAPRCFIGNLLLLLLVYSRMHDFGVAHTLNINKQFSLDFSSLLCDRSRNRVEYILNRF